MNKIKRNLPYVFCVAIGILNLIIMAIPYLEVFIGSGISSVSVRISGYKAMELLNIDIYGIGGVLTSVALILVLILGIFVLLYGVCGLLKAYGIFKQFPDKIGKKDTKKLAEYGLIAFVMLNIITLIFMIVATATYPGTINEDSFSAGLRFNAGIFISLVFSIGAVVALRYINKKHPQIVNGDTDILYECEKCGKSARAKDKFCNACGGSIIEKHGNPDVKLPDVNFDDHIEPTDSDNDNSSL